MFRCIVRVRMIGDNTVDRENKTGLKNGVAPERVSFSSDPDLDSRRLMIR